MSDPPPLIHELAHLRGENQRLREQIAWIPCSERQPLTDALVLVYTTDVTDGYRLARFDGWRWRNSYGPLVGHRVTHWMPLPPAPTSQDQTR